MAIRLTRYGFQSVAPKSTRPNIFNLFPDKKVTRNIFPLISVAGGAARGFAMAAPRIIRSAITKFRAPAAGLPTIQNRLLKTILFGAGAALGSYAATGDIPKPTPRAVAGYAGAQLSPFGAIVGAGTSLSDKTLAILKSRVPPSLSSVPGMITPDELALMFTNARQNIGSNPVIPDFARNIILPGMNIPSAPSISTGFSPSLSIGGQGGSDLPLPLLLAILAGVGGLGFAAGRRRRKKKRYKKRKRHRY